MPILTPTSLDDAVAAVAAAPGADLLAGGTDLLVAINAGRRAVSTVIALTGVPELRTWNRDGDHLVIGAGVTFTELIASEIAPALPALAQAARTVGSPQIRNAGTLGGNLGTASPAGDALPALVALEAEIELTSLEGTRRVPISEFLVGPKRTARSPIEIIVAVHVDAPRGPQEFLKVGTRNAMVISVASLAAVADLDRRTVRVGLGSVGPTVLRAPEAEDFAASAVDWDTGVLVDADAAARFGALTAAAAAPIDDHRSTAAYRRHSIEVLAARALRRLFPTAPRAATAPTGPPGEAAA